MTTLDMFDRWRDASDRASSATPGPAELLPLLPLVVTVPALASRSAVAREPVITSGRPPRFVDRATCPMCGIDRLGVEFHGVLMSGAKVHTIAAHTAERRCVMPRQPRCLGAGMRLVFEDGAWKGAPAP